ncbi:MAG: PhnD/SsuA/transferrin family substrate-binding protein [Acidimicrobiia bacterium]
MLRWCTWLAPGLPLGLFELVTTRVAAVLGRPSTLTFDASVSGPAPGVGDPFSGGTVDLGFLCSPSFQALAAGDAPSVVLVGAAPLWADSRNRGEPVYFAELVVGADGPWAGAAGLAELAGARFGYNDPASLTGWLSLNQRVEALGLGPGFLGRARCTGGHLQSLAQLVSGSIDAAAIDSNTILGYGGLPGGLTIVDTFGPYPVPPVAAAALLAAPVVAAVTEALLGLHHDDATAAALAGFGVNRFVPVSEGDY